MTTGIYKITNKLTNYFYIGSSKNIEKRWKDHISKLRNNNHVNIILQRSFNKYSKDNFHIEIIEKCNINELLMKEQYYLDELNPYYNISKYAKGGDNISHHPNKCEIIKKISETNKKKYKDLPYEKKKEISLNVTGEKNYNYDKKWNDEQRKNLSIKKIEYFKNNKHYKKDKKHIEIFGEQKSNEISKKLSKISSQRIGEKNPFYGKKHKSETKDKWSIIRKGKPGNNNIKIKIDETFYSSYKEASRILDIHLTTIRWRTLSKNYSNYQLI